MTETVGGNPGSGHTELPSASKQGADSLGAGTLPARMPPGRIMARATLFRLRHAKGQGLKHELIAATGGTAVLRAVNIVLMLTVGVVLARVLEPAGYGVYSYALSLVTLLVIPVQMGLPTLVVRNVAAHQARKEWGLLRGLVGWANRFVWLTSVAALAGIAGYLWIRHGELHAWELWTFGWAALAIPLSALGNLRGATLQGLREVVKGQLPEMVLRPGLLLLFVGGGYWVFARVLTPVLAMRMYVGAVAVSYLVGALLLTRHFPSEARDASAEYDRPAWLKSIVPLGFLAAMQVINQHTDILMLGLFRSSIEVGVYRVAIQGASLVPLGLAAVNMVLAPHMARLYARGDRDRLEQLVKQGARVSALTGVPTALLLIVAGGPILRLLFGESYMDARIPLAILSVGQLVNAVVGPVGNLLNMTGHERDTAMGFGVAAGSNVMLNSVLIPAFGAIGASIATAISLVMWNTILLMRVAKRIEVNIW